MSPNNDSLVDVLKNRIIQTRDISIEIMNALKNIQKIENTDLSGVIQYIQRAETDLNEALKNIKEHETRAISRVQSKFEEKYNNNNRLSSNPSLFNKVWHYLTGHE